MDYAADIERAVHELKVERDTWQAVALQYKTAFDAQTKRLEEFQDICFATQAELENERAHQRRVLASSDSSERQRQGIADGAADLHREESFGTAIVFSPRNIGLDQQRRASDDCTNPLFTRVQQCIAQRNYGTALVEVERLLRGPLSSKARAEGLLLKSTVLRASGPDEFFEALAACSEALELCDRLSELEAFLPRIYFQRGVLYYELRMLHSAREAFSMVSDHELLSVQANEYIKSCNEEINQRRAVNRRSGFDEDRTMTESFLAELESRSVEVSPVSDPILASASG